MTCTYEKCRKRARPGRKYCAGHQPIAFIEKYCTHIKGKWAGRPFRFVKWQRDFIMKAFGTLNADGRRQYRTCYLEIPKKNGKSELASAIAIYLICGDDEQGGEVYSAAGDKDQASLVYLPAAQMIRNNKTLSKRLKIVDSRKRVVDFRSNSYYQVLSSEAFTKHGLNPSGVLFDEIHAQPNRELYDVLTEGTDIAREQQLILILTTAGIYDINSIGWEVHDYASKVLRGIIEDKTFLPVIYAAEKFDPETGTGDDWEKPATWKKANPSIGHIFKLDNIRTHYKQAKENPARLNNFLRFRLNVWVNQISRYLPIDDWDKCGGEMPESKEFFKRECYGALDLSSSLDLTAFALVFPPVKENGKFLALLKFYVPEATMFERSKQDGVKYDLWVKAGHITATPGNVIDYAFIRRDIIRASEKYDLRECAYDPWGAVKLAVELENDDGITMVEHRQGFKSMSPPTKELLKMVKSKDINHFNNPVLRWCADNLAVKIDAAENVKPEKDKSTDRIDGVVALIMALGRAITNFDEHSVYDDRGVIVI